MQHIKKIFSDANFRGISYYDQADSKTLFLDESADLHVELKEGEFGFQAQFRNVWSAHKEQLRFEQLVSKISTKLIDLDTELLSEAISAALREVSQYMRSDLSIFLLIDQKTGRFRHPHHWIAPGIPFDFSFLDIDIYNSTPWIARELTKFESIVVGCLHDFPKEAARERALVESMGIKSLVWMPVARRGTFSACIMLNSLRRETAWSQALVRHLKLFGEIFANAVLYSHAKREIQHAHQKIKELEARLESENIPLNGELESILGNPEIIGSTPVMQRLSQQLEQVAETDTTVLLLGETGTGKELIARGLHSRSRRWEKPFRIVNCAALPAPLVESELFGHEKGAFTGATSRKIGRFELADGGTLFLDEIGDLPLELQVKLLRVLQEGEFERVGSTKTRKVDVRVIAATNQILEKMVDEGTFRADLYYRLSVFPITIPPLRFRRDDIPLLVWFFVEKLQSRFGKRFTTISRQDMKRLINYGWPGNVRELSNLVERALILSAEPRLKFNEILADYHETSPELRGVRAASNARLEDMERAHIINVLEQCGWRVRGKCGAAERLGLKRSTLHSRMKKLGIQRPGN